MQVDLRKKVKTFLYLRVTYITRVCKKDLNIKLKPWRKKLTFIIPILPMASGDRSVHLIVQLSML